MANEKPLGKISSNYMTSYKYAAPNGAIRSTQRLVKAQNISEAKNQLTKQLSEEYDWFHIGKILEVSNDHSQQTL